MDRSIEIGRFADRGSDRTLFESSGIIDILHLGILNSISKIGLNAQIPSKKIENNGKDRKSFRFANRVIPKKPEKTGADQKIKPDHSPNSE
ncbi:hypothetical protein CH375_08415 [Leptospira ellisii]|uniref:Uncharacterized protein n=1 Tax=Leptospira ellisii TaxID=2023197 RepID=A0A2N0B524_9LEPT|nr:hypothetical protein CH379_17375 [Leptospira ellisii]PKA04882.1 hypothetical protein CH375_08415 [Leptospira ellisii]